MSKYTCGTILPSGCVIFSGDLPSFIPEDDASCKFNLDDVLKAHADKISLILSNLDLKSLDKKCLVFDPLTVTPKALFQIQIDKICSMSTSLTALEAAFTNLNIGEETVTIDLGCLTPAASPCSHGSNTYTLYSLLMLFKNEICNIKAQL
jgi:hypothetical protein